MARPTGVLGAIGLGAGLMYLFDPDRGKRRRSLIRDKFVHYYKSTEHGAGKAARDISNRAIGLFHKTESMFQKHDTSDDVLVERIRAKMGRIVSHPSAVEVHCTDGRCILSGPILADEVDRLISMVSRTRGVTGIENHLEAHSEAGDISALQGEPAPRGGQFELAQVNWSPAARVVVGTSGGLLTLYGFRRGGFLGTLMGTVGAGMLARSSANMEIKKILGIGVGRGVIDIQKTINIDAPVEDVFNFWTNYENFPRFMANIKEVRDLGEGRSHWKATGPSGIPVSWDCEVTRFEPNDVVAWKSEPGSTIEHAGIVHFSTNRDGGTRVDIRMSYNPPAGALGHALASIFGADPKKSMDEDLARMKTLLEAGKAPREEVTAAGAA